MPPKTENLLPEGEPCVPRFLRRRANNSFVDDGKNEIPQSTEQRASSPAPSARGSTSNKE